jgi:hypothetical protein
MNSDDFDNAAGHWRLSVHNQEQYLEALIVRLQTSLPGTVSVARGFAPFAKKKPLKSLEISLGDDTFRLRYAKNSGIQTSIGTAVRGIVLKNQDLPFPEWMQTLNEKIKQYSQIHSKTEDILEDFLL